MNNANISNNEQSEKNTNANTNKKQYIKLRPIVIKEKNIKKSNQTKEKVSENDENAKN